MDTGCTCTCDIIACGKEDRCVRYIIRDRVHNRFDQRAPRVRKTCSYRKQGDFSLDINRV